MLTTALSMLFRSESLETAPIWADADEQAVGTAHATSGGWHSNAAPPSSAATDTGSSVAVPCAEPSFACRCDIHSISGKDVVRDPTTFIERFLRGAQPVIIRGLLHADPSLAPAARAFGKAALLERLGETVWEVGEIPYEARYQVNRSEPMKLRAYVEKHLDGCSAIHKHLDGCSAIEKHLDGCSATAAADADTAANADTAAGAADTDTTVDCAPRYVFDVNFWRGDVQVSVKKLKLVSLPSWATAAGVRPASHGVQFFMGPANSGAPMHFHGAAYNLLVHGRKRWLLTPPGHSTFSMLPARKWLSTRLPQLRARNASVFECEQHAGDMLVLPDLWGHLTINMEISVGVAQEFAH